MPSQVCKTFPSRASWPNFLFIPPRRGLISSMCSGFVASIIRAAIFFDTSALEDRTWSSIELVGWSIIETSVYIITCCLPHLRPLISHYTPRWLKKAVHITVSRSYGAMSDAKSYGATSKGVSGIHKSTVVSHSHQMNGNRDLDDDDIELTNPHYIGNSGNYSMDLDRVSSPGSSGTSAGTLGPQQSRPMGVTTEITSQASRHPGNVI